LKLQSLAKDEGSKGDHVVAPFARDEEIGAILSEIEWRAVDESVAWQKLSSAYAWSFTFLVSLFLIPVVIQSLIMPWIGAVGLVVITVVIATRWLGWRRYRYAIDGDRLLVRSGWWKRRLVILPLASIQSVDVTENIISRRLGSAALTVGVASGSGFSTHGIPAVPREIARTLRQRLLAPFA